MIYKLLMILILLVSTGIATVGYCQSQSEYDKAADKIFEQERRNYKISDDSRRSNEVIDNMRKERLEKERIEKEAEQKENQIIIIGSLIAVTVVGLGVFVYFNRNKNYTDVKANNSDKGTCKTDNFKFCPKCGARLRQEDVFCSKCGNKQPKN